jgi:hypothetical protein
MVARICCGKPCWMPFAQWTYRPYLLDNKPVRVETTINIVFPPNR